jgi:hypothetical protein
MKRLNVLVCSLLLLSANAVADNAKKEVCLGLADTAVISATKQHDGYTYNQVMTQLEKMFSKKNYFSNDETVNRAEINLFTVSARKGYLLAKEGLSYKNIHLNIFQSCMENFNP